jgi:hypothetical protein
MSKILLVVLMALPLAAADAKPAKSAAQEPKEPPAAALAHAGDICKTTGGFGRVFGRGYGHVDATASDEWAPFERLTIEPGRITAEASFSGATDNLEGDVEKADRFLKALDRAIAAKHHFPHRETSGAAVRFSAGKDKGSGTTLILEREQDQIRAVCSGG